MSEQHTQIIDQEQFIIAANLKYDNKYVYSRVKYVNEYTSVIVICPQHGELLLMPTRHRRGVDGCKKCHKIEITQRPVTNDFVRRATLIHGDKYNYSKTVYIDEDTQICIISSAGEFHQTPKDHLLNGDKDQSLEYKQCDYALYKNAENTSNFVQRATLRHGDKYTYSGTVYYCQDIRVDIKCVKHGSLYQTPILHLTNIDDCVTCIQQQEQLRDYLLAENNPQKRKIDQLNLFVMVKMHQAERLEVPLKLHYENDYYDTIEFLTAMRELKNTYITVKNNLLVSLGSVLNPDDNNMRFKQLVDSLDVNPKYITAQLEFARVYTHYKKIKIPTTNSVVKEIIRLFEIDDFKNIRQFDLIESILQGYSTG